MSGVKHGPLPPVFFLGGLLLQWGLHAFLPFVRLVPEAWAASGAIPIVVGIALVVLGERRFKKVRTVINPFDQPSVLVTSGVFRAATRCIWR
jgi:protein-S-isoprenylcysteine O-methyltransferase Ste14